MDAQNRLLLANDRLVDFRRRADAERAAAAAREVSHRAPGRRLALRLARPVPPAANRTLAA